MTRARNPSCPNSCQNSEKTCHLQLAIDLHSVAHSHLHLPHSFTRLDPLAAFLSAQLNKTPTLVAHITMARKPCSSTTHLLLLRSPTSVPPFRLKLIAPWTSPGISIAVVVAQQIISARFPAPAHFEGLVDGAEEIFCEVRGEGCDAI